LEQCHLPSRTKGAIPAIEEIPRKLKRGMIKPYSIVCAN